MAGSGDIRQKIVLEGEREYASALKEAQRHLKVLRSELKAESAELKNNGTQQEQNAAKVKNLKQQIQEQEKIVETYRKALDEVREKYGDNEEAIARWEIKLNDARTALANMQNELQNTGKSFDTVSSSAENGISASHDFAESLEKIADVGGSVSDSIENAFMGIIGHIHDAIVALWGDLTETAARANNWTDVGAMFGTSASEIQQWYHAARAAGKDFGTLTGMGQKILTADAHAIAEATGIDITGYTNKWEAFYHVMRELSEMDQEGQFAALEHMGIKGPKEAGWNDMLNAWSDITGNLGEYDAENGGLGMSEEQLANMNELSLSAAKLSESWQAFKDSWLAGLAPLALEITGNFEEIIHALNDYMGAETKEERDAAIQRIRESIENIFAAIRDAFEKGLGLLGELASNLKESDDPMARALGEMLDKLVGALEWFANPENWKAVETGFKAIIGVWATGRIAQAVGNASAFAAHLSTIFGAGAGGTAAVGGGGGALGGLAATAKAAVGGALGGLGGLALTSAAPLAAGLAPALIAQAQTEQEAKDRQLAYEAAAATAELRGDVETAAILEGAARGIGPERNADGTYKYGLFGQLGLNPSEITDQTLLGLADRNNIQKAQLYNMVNTYAPEGTWSTLNRYWEKQDLDPWEVTQLMSDMAQAATAWQEAQIRHEEEDTGWEERMLQSQDFATQTNQALKNSADNVSKIDFAGEIRSGMSGITVLLDGETAGRLLAPRISEYLARDMVE